jgi:hypothetical protein
MRSYAEWINTITEAAPLFLPLQHTCEWLPREPVNIRPAVDGISSVLRVPASKGRGALRLYLACVVMIGGVLASQPTAWPS